MSSDPASASPDFATEESVAPETTVNERAVNGQPAAESTASPAAEPQSLLDQVIARDPSDSKTPSVNQLDQFLAADEVGQALRLWLGTPERFNKEELTLRLNRDVAFIDELLNEQVNAILHHPKFQKLEASWRGLEYLVDSIARQGGELIQVRVLNLSWRELAKDLDKAPEFDQSQLFKKIYEDEFGTPGGTPYGAMIADYEIHARPTKDHDFDDIKILEQISHVAAAAFCPFITGVDPSMFGINSFDGLQHVEDLERGFTGAEFIKWRAFRESEDARFVGLAMPRILLRRPYANDGTRKDRFVFEEDTAARDRSKYLFGNAAFAFGEVLARAYSQSGWLAEIRGVERDTDWGGLVTGLPVANYGTDREGIATKSSTDVIITDQQESVLSHLGFLPLCHCYDTEYSAFYSTRSVQKPKKYDRPGATQNAKISSMLQYMFCVSQFAHYIKVIARDKIGGHMEPEDCARVLDRWIKKYVTPDDQASPDTKARRPLRGAEIAIKRDPAKPGSYLCTFHLWPHYQLDDLSALLRLRTTLQPIGGGGDGKT